MTEVREMLKADRDVDDIYGGWTALEQASRAGHINIVRLILQTGAKLDVVMDGIWLFRRRGTALHWAADRGHLDIVKLLVQEGANLDAFVLRSHGCESDSPLSAAAGSGHLNVVKYLLDVGADKNSKEGIQG